MTVSVMKFMKFPYIQVGKQYRPIVSVDFSYNGQTIPTQVLVDSGADITLMHADVAEILEIDLKKGLPGLPE